MSESKYIKAVSELSEHAIANTGVDGYKTALSDTKDNLSIPKGLGRSTDSELLTELSYKVGNKYESKKFKFSNFTRNVYTLFQAINNKIVDIITAIGADSTTGTIKGRIKALEDDVATLKQNTGEKLDALARRVSDLETAVGDDNKPNTLKGRIKALENEIGNNTTPNSLKYRVTLNENAIGSVSGRVTTLENTVGASDTASGSLRYRIKQIELGNCGQYLNKEITNVALTVKGSVSFNNLITGTITNANSAGRATSAGSADSATRAGYADSAGIATLAKWA